MCIWHMHIFFGEGSFPIFCLYFELFFFVVEFLCLLCSLDTSLSTDTCCASILSESEDSLFILLTVSLSEQKILFSVKSKLSLFSFRIHTFGAVCKNSSSNPRSLRFSSTSFLTLSNSMLKHLQCFSAFTLLPRKLRHKLATNARISGLEGYKRILALNAR